MIILVLGPQGSGKGTQGKLLASRLDYFYFDVGAHLRKIAKTDPRINQIVNKRGELLPDEEIFQIVTKHLEENHLYDNIILDGYPRSSAQYELIKNWFATHGTKINKAILLTVSDEVSIKRLSARRSDPVTGKIYNLITKVPGPEVDPRKLLQREDDKPEAIAERLRLYHQTTGPLVDLLKKEGILVEVDGERPIEDIQGSINEIFNGEI
jgi:adenylate kinase